MNDNALHNRIAEASKTLFSYCMARTPNRWEAEDLCQDILCELVKSSARLRDERAFYAFMWSLAGNVYKQWCRKRAGGAHLPAPGGRRGDTRGRGRRRIRRGALPPAARAVPAFGKISPRDGAVLSGAEILRRNRVQPWRQREHGQVSAVQIQKEIERGVRNGTKTGYAQLCA